MIGTVLSSRFRLEEQIGSGGMSTVYRAFDETLERPVAIKIMHRSLSGDEVQLERFRREARAAARLSHPHVVTVIDAGEDQGHPYIVFEFVDGETLKRRIKRVGPLPVVEAVAYAVEIGRALAAAHAERLVHRDVKPQNVLIDADGRAKVTDFGIARSLEDGGLTATGRVVGTTDYVSPEQALGEEVTEQSDLYSLGVCLYEMLTGSLPFVAEGQVAVAMKHVQEPMPDVQRGRPEVSAALAAVVERATAKQVENRYGSAEEMVADLEQALAIEAARSGEASGEATTVLQALPDEAGRLAPGRLRHPRRVLALSALAAVALAVGGVLVIANTSRDRNDQPAASPGPPPAPVRIAAVHDYDPYSDEKSEHPELVERVLDDDDTTGWTTERYNAGTLPKPGVGLYLDAGVPIAARRIDLRSPTPGFVVQVYGSSLAPFAEPTPESFARWGKPLATKTVDAKRSIALDTGGRQLRYYLVWIAKLPPTGGRVDLATVRLLR
ncbi:MAG TPA: protein kinase [Thermoleophilaceae bacterium]|jgi:serine/threonine-protein kinase